jgi:hypothetical protein
MTFSAASATHDRWPLRRNVAGIHLEELPRMADFSLWATACETAFWPAGTFTQAYQANRRAAIEDLIDADPVAARIREIMTNRSTWTGSASDLLRAGAALAGPGLPSGAAAWPRSPRELSGRLRRAQTFLRVLGIHIAFSREGRAGTFIRGPKIPSAPSASATMITIPDLTNGRRGPSVQPETTAIDPGSGRPTKLTVLTQKLPFILDNLRVLKSASSWWWRGADGCWQRRTGGAGLGLSGFAEPGAATAARQEDTGSRDPQGGARTRNGVKKQLRLPRGGRRTVRDEDRGGGDWGLPFQSDRMHARATEETDRPAAAARRETRVGKHRVVSAVSNEATPLSSQATASPSMQRLEIPSGETRTISPLFPPISS